MSLNNLTNKELANIIYSIENEKIVNKRKIEKTKIEKKNDNNFRLITIKKQMELGKWGRPCLKVELDNIICNGWDEINKILGYHSPKFNYANDEQTLVWNKGKTKKYSLKILED